MGIGTLQPKELFFILVMFLAMLVIFGGIIFAAVFMALKMARRDMRDEGTVARAVQE